MHMFRHDGPNLTPQVCPIIGPGQGFYRKSLHKKITLNLVMALMDRLAVRAKP
jgi:hypothetical protein